LENLVGKTGDKAAVLHNVSSSNGWTNRSCKPHTINIAASCPKEESEIVGRKLASCGVAYNREVHPTTKFCPFEIVSGFKPTAPIDLLP